LGFNLWSYIDNRSNTPGGPNVVLIGIDTLRADHLSCSGYERNTTPNIDVVASEASVFKRAFATTSWTLPSFHSIMTSLYQASHGVITHKHRLDRSHVTLAEILKNQGYRTAGFVSGPFLKAIYGFDQGFDVYEESVSSASVIEANEDITSPALTDLVLPWLQENAGNRFFLFIHYWDPHADYIPPAPYDKIFDPYYEGTMDGTNIKWTDKVSTLTSKRDVEHIVALYDGEITWTDDHVGQVMNTLRESGLDENTVVVIVSDHGEEFLDHGGKVHGMTIYNEVIHVPLIFRIPGVSEARKFESVVSTVDVMPTILDILDIGLPRSIDGESLMAIINGERDKKRTNEVYSELLHNLTTVVRGRWKLIYDSEVDRFELYDIETDFSESDDLAPSNATIVQELANVLSDWLTAKKSGQVAAPEVHENEKTMKQLKALGYIQ
jgi:arylsulfatase A-like enzyme